MTADVTSVLKNRGGHARILQFPTDLERGQEPVSVFRRAIVHGMNHGDRHNFSRTMTCHALRSGEGSPPDAGKMIKPPQAVNGYFRRGRHLPCLACLRRKNPLRCSFRKQSRCRRSSRCTRDGLASPYQTRQSKEVETLPKMRCAGQPSAALQSLPQAAEDFVAAR